MQSHTLPNSQSATEKNSWLAAGRFEAYLFRDEDVYQIMALLLSLPYQEVHFISITCFPQNVNAVFFCFYAAPQFDFESSGLHEASFQKIRTIFGPKCTVVVYVL